MPGVTIMSALEMRGFALGVAVCFGAATASAQTTFPETEPNSLKTEADQVTCMQAGDILTGTTTGATVAGGSTLVTTADTFRVKSCALPIGIYEHRLVITTAGTAGHTGTIRGLTQVGGVIQTGTDIAMQTSSTTTVPARYNEWYGFGKQEENYYRITGTTATTAPYTVTMQTVPIVPVVVPGTFAPGMLTITTENQGHVSDTDFWIYDSNLNAIPLFGNDDTPFSLPGGGVNFESTLVANFAPGTYFLALSNFQFGNDQAAAPTDYQTGNVVDFPDAAVCGPEFPAVPLDMSFAISDGVLTSPVAVLKTETYAIHWFQFTVGGAPVGYCFGDGSGTACPCGNAGSAGNGCASSVNQNGANLASTGVPSIAGDTLVLHGTGMPSSSALYFQGTTQTAGGPGAPFGDGLRCAGGSIIRLGTKTNVSGSSQYPSGADASVSVRGQCVAGNTRTYQVWYRNAAAFCTPSTFNLTNGLSVMWIP